MWACCQLQQGNWVINDMAKAEVLSAFFALAFTSKIRLQGSQVPETQMGSLEQGRATLSGGELG